MAWRYPPHLIAPNRVVEMEDMNEDFQVFVEEASGHLNEHNFASGIFSSHRSRLADDIGIRLYRDSQVSDPNSGSFPIYYPTNGFPLGSQRNLWKPISDMSISLDSPGSTILITFSAQFNGGTAAVQFGLEVNGALLPSSVIGGLDLQNDNQSLSSDAGYQTNSNLIGLFGERLPFVLEASLDLLPGNYTVRPVFYLPEASTGLTGFVSNRELFIIETVR
tara:strand:+ start:748 stop:1407 length:660 start_codon:yes stop_codon:yes gene_type:complete